MIRVRTSMLVLAIIVLASAHTISGEAAERVVLDAAGNMELWGEFIRFQRVFSNGQAYVFASFKNRIALFQGGEALAEIDLSKACDGRSYVLDDAAIISEKNRKFISLKIRVNGDVGLAAGSPNGVIVYLLHSEADKSGSLPLTQAGSLGVQSCLLTEEERLVAGMPESVRHDLKIGDQQFVVYEQVGDVFKSIVRFSGKERYRTVAGKLKEMGVHPSKITYPVDGEHRDVVLVFGARHESSFQIFSLEKAAVIREVKFPTVKGDLRFYGDGISGSESQGGISCIRADLTYGMKSFDGFEIVKCGLETPGVNYFALTSPGGEVRRIVSVVE